MKTNSLTTLLLCAASLGFSSGAMAAPNDSASSSPASSPSSSQMNSSQTNSSDNTLYNGYLLGTKIVGSTVQNLQNQELGTISDLIVNPDTGRVRFAVLSVGASDKVAVPWDAIQLEKNKAGEAPAYALDVSKQKLDNAPKFDASKLSDLYAKANALPIFEYYLITYYDDLPAPGKGTPKANSANGSSNPIASPSPAESPSALASPSPIASPMTKNSSMANPSPSPAK